MKKNLVVIEELKKQGKTIILILHDLSQVMWVNSMARFTISVSSFDFRRENPR